MTTMLYQLVGWGGRGPASIIDRDLHRYRLSISHTPPVTARKLPLLLRPGPAGAAAPPGAGLRARGCTHVAHGATATQGFVALLQLSAALLVAI
jgi:hypothetical protein